MPYTCGMLKFARHHRYFAAFLAGTLLYLLACLPAIAYRGGFFYYFGDYVFQTIEFYMSAHQAVADGYLWWNPNIELGGSMAGSYGFYLWGSPFFWASMLLPTSAVPYALPAIMALRYGTATCTAFLWVRQFTRTDRAALIGALLYAFSGFQAVNIVFSHFHDVTAFFPLYLYGFDRLMREERHAGTLFALGTALMACINYYFFFGEVVFLAIYYLIRYRAWRPAAARRALRELRLRQKAGGGKRDPLLQRDDKGVWTTRAMRALRAADPSLADSELRRRSRNRRLLAAACAYGFLGVLLAAAFLVQTVGGVMGNSRISSHISGDDLLAFREPTTFWSIVKSAFLVPELMGRQSLFNNSEIQWASVSLYLPCLSLAGVIAYILKTRQGRGGACADWKVRLIAALGAMAVIPGLSALFSAMNSTFYARWYYLPVLVAAAMSAEALERAGTRNLKRGATAVLAATLFFLAFGFLPGQAEPIANGLLSVPGNFKYYALIIVSTLAMLVFLWLLLVNRSTRPQGSNLASWSAAGAIAFCCALSTGCVLLDGCLVYSNGEAENFEVQCLQNAPDVDESSYARVETDDSAQNWALIWGLPVNRTFLSTPASSTFDIYETFEDGRMQESNIDMSHAGLRHLMSTRYYLRNITKADPPSSDLFGGLFGSSSSVPLVEDAASDDDAGSATPSGYERTGETDGFAVYETRHFIPMGFTFDTFMTERAYTQLRKNSHLPSIAADRLLVKDLILTDEQAERYGHLLQEDESMPESAMTLNRFFDYADERAASACSAFGADPGGYTASISLDRENLVFFSIPYDRGFKAFVDGQPAALEKVDYGFMAVDVPAGTHEIRLAWHPWGIEFGIAGSAAATIILAMLALRERRRRPSASDRLGGAHVQRGA